MDLRKTGLGLILASMFLPINSPSEMTPARDVVDSRATVEYATTTTTSPELCVYDSLRSVYGDAGTLEGKFLWPVSAGMPGSPYGMRKHPKTHRWKLHEGMDIRAPDPKTIHLNRPAILAPYAGIVTKVVKSPSAGNMVEIYHGTDEHGDAITTTYMHMHRPALVQVGDTVPRGYKIGEVGESGVAKGPHLHFELSKNGKKVNPMPYFITRIQTAYASQGREALLTFDTVQANALDLYAQLDKKYVPKQ